MTQGLRPFLFIKDPGKKQSSWLTLRHVTHMVDSQVIPCIRTLDNSMVKAEAWIR